MRLAHLKCPNCDGFIEFNDAQGLFCKSCGSELMIKLDPEDFELEELKAMPEILNDKYTYEKKLYESELKGDEEANKERLRQEWRENSFVTNPQKKRKFIKGYIIAIVGIAIFLVMVTTVVGIVSSLSSSIGSSVLKNSDNKVNIKNLLKLETPQDLRPVESFVDLRNTPVNSFEDISYCMENYLKDQNDPFEWDSIEFKNAFVVSGTGTSKLLGVYEETCGDYSVCRVVELDDLMFDPVTREVKTNMDLHPLYGHKEGNLHGAYTDYDEFYDSEIAPKGDSVKAYN